MKELKKPNQLEEIYSTIDSNCETACTNRGGTGCTCRNNPESTDNEEIIF